MKPLHYDRERRTEQLDQQEKVERKLLIGEAHDIRPTVRNGRYWAGGYSSDSIEGLRKILAYLKKSHG